MALHAAEALGKRFSIAMLAAGANLGAATDGVPGGVGPFDVGIEARGVRLIRRSRGVESQGSS